MDLDIIRGDTVNIQFEVESDTVLDLDSDDFSVTFSLKKTTTDTAYIFQKDKTAVTSPADNVFILRIAPEDTTHLLPGYYFYDIQLGIGDDIYTIAIGKFTINVDITRPPVVLPEFPFPDINNDGLITETDAQMILTASINIVQGLPSGLTEEQEDLADCNRDGVIDSIDVSLVLAFCTDVANGLYNNTALGWTLFMTDNYTS
jgi:hypothetical protein